MRNTYQTVAVSLDEWDLERARLVLAPMLASPSEPHALIRSVHERLLREVPWYGLVSTVYDPTTHELFAGLANGTAVEAFATALERCRQATLRRVFWIAEHPARTPEALQLALVELVSQTLAEIGTDETWFHTVHPMTEWLFEANGFPLNDALSWNLEVIVERHFRSWVSPSAPVRQTFAEEATWAVLEARLDADG